MNRSPRLKNRPHQSRQTLIVIGLGAMLAVVAAAISDVATIGHDKIAAAPTPNDDEIFTGSILYTPDEGNVCRQLLFDNRDGRFTDNGNVDCERAAYRGAEDAPKLWSADRVRVISTGFREH